ncbi:Disease resistance protein RGA2 [Linum perenne]
MAAVLAEVVLKKLGSLAADQASLPWGLKSEIPKLQSTVSTIQAVLLDAEEQSNHNHQVQPWLRELRGVLYDAEDMLDDFFTEVLRKNQMVCVSETFEPKLLLKNILESITTQKVEDLALNTLKDILHEKIKNKRLLLVLDDVWNEDTEKWGCFQNILSSGATEGSKILVTTRLRIVAEMTTTDVMVPYELDSLSQPDSWSLFKTIAFKKETTPDPRFVEIGEEIVRKCGGVPLAVRTMATLKLSYDNLPFHLKRCFVYCSVFQKDHVFDVQMLIQLWMAQGYIKSSQSLHLEDVGVEYFKNLLWRSFFQEVTDDTWGSMGSCKMHDLIHDLAVTVAGEDVLVLKASNVTDHDFGGGSINFERIRHISIDFEDKSRETWKVPPILAKATKLRTFLVHNVPRPGVHLEAGGCEKIFSNMKRLRVLSLNRVCVKIVPATIHKLKHLRYLDLSHSEMEMLPDDEILTLVNLQVLFLHWCSKLRQLPQNIGKLSNLAYLGLDGCSSLSWIPAGIRKLTYLRELSLFV